MDNGLTRKEAEMGRLTRDEADPAKVFRWVRVSNKDELEAFYRGVLPAIITAAKEHGYAIGVHGSLRRDLDLIAAPWTEDYSGKDELAQAIHEAALGPVQEKYNWTEKPLGRLASSFPICWTENSEAFQLETNLGNIDLSVMPALSLESVREEALEEAAGLILSRYTPLDKFCAMDIVNAIRALQHAPARVAEGEHIYTKADMEAACALVLAGFRSKPMLDKMVDRFLAWPLPFSVCADLVATRQARGRIGTNLLSATEARQMLDHVLAVAPESPAKEQPGEPNEH